MNLLRLTVAFVALPAFAQDTRHVTEPQFPPACTVLLARLPEAGDRAPDTARIQAAIDQCRAGHGAAGR